MRFIGLPLYGIGCFITLTYLFSSADWQQFYDPQSLICTLLPAICAFFLRPSKPTTARCVFICWISAGLTTVYGLIRIFGHYPIDLDAVLAGCSVALLPIFYAFIFTLIAFPITIKIKPSA